MDTDSQKENIDFRKLIAFCFLSPAALCNAPLGVSNKRVIPDGRITASSEANQYHAARLARLGQVKKGSYIGAWCARHNNYYQWLKVDFGRLRKVTQVVTQGRYDYGQWVTSFYLTSSMDNVHWSMYRFKSANKVKAVYSCHVVYCVTYCVISRGVSCYRSPSRQVFCHLATLLFLTLY